ncbi:Tea1p KNAG_0E00450 [Huiozyma naganishii CBS 8797]|uniref:Zn(2)-C6 fungal-type domain-containing protein n=1 Tax=Huiozyma naganishii (strain ATCC MYA-139 / BCRC 22969 / CBS 8797 / KCTC 17520 / NBRC 10181 / NCYC 3082 / Yp74L-3) TaxID=1071383 RepID=J7RLC0_HUIN7|nr:hypothetical protein KNAG_0E00450 [Kazachstania naganishii CBS 8797]CCK70313.1 hypothetical protein KNAG_0E00450 [Kazachstania naganishii CBS 8797]
MREDTVSSGMHFPTGPGNSDFDGERRTPVLGPTGKKRLSCSNCRKRRKKCDLGFPCGNCTRLEIECNVNEDDLRKKRYTSGYVKSLEAHCAYLESNLKAVVDKLYPNNEQVLNSMMIGDVISNVDASATATPDPTFHSDAAASAAAAVATVSAPSHSTAMPAPVPNKSKITILPPLHIEQADISARQLRHLEHADSAERKPKKTLVKGSLYPEGPVTYKVRPGAYSSNSSASLASTDSITPSTRSQTPDSMDSTGPTHPSINQAQAHNRIADLKTTVIKRISSSDSNRINTDPKILQSLSNFYRWLYPGHFIFMHRESFLYGFFNHAEDDYSTSEYCSMELIYAVCAIGSRLSLELQDFSEMYYEKSKTALLKLVFDENSVTSITTVQALLCLAFYELGKGNNQLAWYFSGLAIRVGYEMGFQLDPEVWYTDADDNGKGKLTKSELEIRSRIYWGCYIADHFICLMLGRTSTLSVSNSTIPASDELPEVEGTEEFRFIGGHVLQVALPLKNLIILSRIVQIFISKIFIESQDNTARLEYLATFNNQVYSWRQSLPEFLLWSQELIKDEDVSTDPTVSYFWYYYYIVLLTFNKPFIEESEESRVVVIEIIDDLQTLFTNFSHKFHNYEKATLYQLYACLLAISCLRKLQIIDSPRWDNSFRLFLRIFHEKLYPQYILPAKLKEEPIQNLVYNQDFTLSHEIDDLIKELFGV